jgi:deoxyribodipyrimidine photo-lyase
MTSSSDKKSTALVWFRNDLRLADNPAVVAAVESGAAMAFLYVLDDETPGEWKAGGAARWWLHGSLDALSRELENLGVTLILRHGPADQVVQDVVADLDADAVYWNRGYDPFTIARDKKIKAALKENEVTVESFGGTLLNEPWTIETKAGGFYKVYTRYWYAVRDKGDPPRPLAAPTTVSAADVSHCASNALADWNLLPTKPDWAEGFRDRWTPGAEGAMKRLHAFLDDALPDYKSRRDFPAEPKTSNLSPHLHIGDISPRQIWHATVDKVGWTDEAEAFLKEVVWREFAHHVFYYMPDLPDDPMSDKFADFPWEENQDALRAWQQGRTGYPLVDAGMRELWQTGHMHNRVRMVVGSFLVKHLLLPWQAGEAWFWDTLVDADLAVNAFSWQWVAGCGADAAPYFRIFNPITQAEKFDPDGTYIRTYVPEIADLPGKHLFRPWEAPEMVLKSAGVTLDETYPRPIVDHKFARERALDAFKNLPKPSV